TMLTHGANHRGAAAVPAIRVGAGGHRPRRTFQLALIRPSDHARGQDQRAAVPKLTTPTPTLPTAPLRFAGGGGERRRCASRKKKERTRDERPRDERPRHDRRPLSDRATRERAAGARPPSAAYRGSAAGHRARALRRRHQFPAPAPYAHRALA